MGFRLSPTSEQRLRYRPRMGLLSWLIAGVVAVICVAFTRAFVVQTFRIPSSSMMPTLQIGDHIVVNKIVYGIGLPGGSGRVLAISEPQRGEVVVFYRFSELETLDFNTHYIKRIVAIPGDEVEVRNFQTFVNGKEVERYDQSLVYESGGGSTEAAGRDYGPVKLEAGRYFVLGDNRANSRDSRYYGPIHLTDIEGRASFVYWSWDLRTSPAKLRVDRIGKRIR